LDVNWGGGFWRATDPSRWPTNVRSRVVGLLGGPLQEGGRRAAAAGLLQGSLRNSHWVKHWVPSSPAPAPSLVPLPWPPPHWEAPLVDPSGQRPAVGGLGGRRAIIGRPTTTGSRWLTLYSLHVSALTEFRLVVLVRGWRWDGANRQWLREALPAPCSPLAAPQPPQPRCPAAPLLHCPTAPLPRALGEDF